jgi:hypothetical protein
MTLPTSKSFTAGHFELQLDGSKVTTYLKNVSGGWPKAQAIDDGVGPQHGRIKHLGPVEIDPMQVEFGISGADPVLQWIQGSWSRRYTRRNGQITHADFNLKQTFEHMFTDALILETTFPTLDAASKDNAYLKCKFQPESVRTVQSNSPGPQLQSQFTYKQKFWTPSSFRLRIDQFDGMEHTSKIDSMTIKQGVKKMYTGKDRFPQIEPTKLEFPNIVGYISLAYAKRLLQWHNEYVMTGDKDPKAQLSGSIEYLSPDRAKTIFSINFFEAGLMAAHIEDAQANVDQIKRVKFEMFVGYMTLDGHGQLALE